MSCLKRLFFLLLLCGLPGCEQSTPTQEQPVDTQVEPAAVANRPDIAPLTEELEAPANYPFENTWVGDLDALVERRVIRILTVYSLPRYYLENGRQQGLVKELSVLLEKFLNRRDPRKHVKVHVTITPLARDQLIPALLAGRGDIVMAGLTITPQREQLVDFSISPTSPVAEILVTGPSAPAIDSIDDLGGQTVYVRRSSSYHDSLQRLNQRLLAQGKPPVVIEPASELLEDDDLIQMVNSGLLPWAIVDDYKLQLWDQVFTQLEARPDIVFRSGGSMAWAFRKDSPLLAKSINTFVNQHRRGTLIGNMLIKRYFTNFDWAENALAQDEFSRFEELEDVFQKYGELYEIDYLLAAAQGFQESRLDQSARSHAGAIGVMQLLPSTASDPNVGIPDIHLVDDNIHAGMKYLSFLRRRYFSDPQIDPLNQTLLALAAYNAGPGRMIRLRRKAGEMGYDPNVWFDNVELVAAADVGREPVQYVANILKYSTAYRLAIKQATRRQAARERAGIL